MLSLTLSVVSTVVHHYCGARKTDYQNALQQLMSANSWTARQVNLRHRYSATPLRDAAIEQY